MTLTTPVCYGCTRYQGNHRCVAFPDGIPDVVWNGENDHANPIDGDGGKQYDPGRPEMMAEKKG